MIHTQPGPLAGRTVDVDLLVPGTTLRQRGRLVHLREVIDEEAR